MPTKPRSAARKSRDRRVQLSAVADHPPAWIKPQLAALVKEAPDGPDSLHELKLDGYRMHARLDAGRVNIRTRRGNDWTEKYPTIAEAIAALPAQNAYLDGELCGVLPDGRTAFNLIQNASDTGEGALVFFLFDLLFLDGENLLTVPLLDRKARLASLLTSPPDRLQYNDHQIRPRSGLSPLGLRTRPRRRRVEAHQREVRARSALLAEDQMPQP